MKTLVWSVVVSGFLFGCGESNYGGEVKIDAKKLQANQEAEIKRIEADPHMPPQAKAAQIGAIKAHMGDQAAQYGKGMNGPTTK